MELLVVTIIAGILAAIAAPSWLSFLNRQKVRSTRQQVVDVIRKAQSEAIRMRTNHIAILTTNNSRVVFDSNADGNFDNVILDEDFPNPDIIDLEVVSPNAGNTAEVAVNSISFDHLGAIDDSHNVPIVVRINLDYNGDTTPEAVYCARIESLLASITTATSDDINNSSPTDACDARLTP
jgi:type II secretory pathway pseudopilin PulG